MRARRDPLAACREPTVADLWWDRAYSDAKGERRAFWLMCAIHAFGWPVIFIAATGGL